MKKLIVLFLSLFLMISLTSCEEKGIVVSFDTLGGSEIVSVEIQKGELLDEPTTPTKNGYNFEGWYKDESYSEKWNFEEESITEAITLYAKWSLTVGEALKIAGNLAQGEKTEERYLVRGTIESILDSRYGKMVIFDSTGSISVYGTYGSDGVDRYEALADKPYANDEVLLSAILQNYNGSLEIYSGWIMEFTKAEVDINDADYTDMSVEEIRQAEAGTLVKVDGVVARITYANGMIPSGFYLVDDTNSIYVYDSQIAARVSVGNKVTIVGEKTYWILDTEASNAAKFGYKGCNQIANVQLVENDNKTTNEFAKDWITTSTVKRMMDTDASVDITTTIYKVNALVKKVPGTGFTNYYFFDLDGTTGSYTYTQCNGSDFTWLDEFDGKICTVYLSALNAKSTAAGCNWRFIPVLVVNEGFTFNINDAAKFAVEYFGLTQFEASYTSDPALELLNSVSSDLLGFEGASLSYTSSNNDVIYFETTSENVVMHAGNPGTAVITVTGTYNGNEFSTNYTITVSEPPQYDALTVKEAIDTAAETIITVKGIVGPSLVNQVGFYLIDETGVIAVKTDADTMASLKLGQEVVMKGNRVNYNAEGCVGQICLLDSELIVNLYGNHEYSTASFDTTKTLADLISLSVNEHHTAEVYVVEVQFKFVETAYYSNAYIVYGDAELLLYTSSGNQYSWLKQFNGETITVELALCNWNKKSSYRGCVLSATSSDGTQIFNELNFSD